MYSSKEMMDAALEDAEIENTIKVKSTISANLNHVALLEVLRGIVDDAPCFDFASKSKRKFITPARPELILDMDFGKVAELYPDESKELSKLVETAEKLLTQYGTTERSEVKTALGNVDAARSAIAAREITDPITNFFTGVFMYILKGEIPEQYSEYTDYIMSVIGDRDPEELRDSIREIMKVGEIKHKTPEEMTEEDERLGFIFSIAAVIGQPAAEEVLYATSVVVEIVY